MKSSRLVIAVASAFLVLLVPAVAQSVAVQATIPFNFSVGTQAMKAGDYRVSFEGRGGQMWISRVGAGDAITALTNAVGGGQTPERLPKLVFHRYGDHYFLSEVWTGGGTYRGRQLMISSTEREYARAKKSGSTTVLAARRILVLPSTVLASPFYHDDPFSHQTSRS